MWGISRLVQNLLASQEGLCSVQLVSSLLYPHRKSPPVSIKEKAWWAPDSFLFLGIKIQFFGSPAPSLVTTLFEVSRLHRIPQNSQDFWNWDSESKGHSGHISSKFYFLQVILFTYIQCVIRNFVFNSQHMTKWKRELFSRIKKICQLP